MEPSSISVKKDEKVLTIEFAPPSLTDRHVRDFRRAVEADGTPDTVVMDWLAFQHLPESQALSELSAFAKDSRAEGRSFVLLAGREVMDRIQGSELERAVRSVIEFNRVQVIEEGVQVEGDLPQVIQAFTTGLLQTLNDMGVESRALHCLENREPSPGSIEVAGTVDFDVAHFKGRLILSFPLPAYLKIVSKIMGQTYDTLVPEVTDWSAEIINMSSSLAKDLLRRSGHNVEVSLPRVMPQSGSGIRTKFLSHKTVPFDSEFGVFYLEILCDSAATD